MLLVTFPALSHPLSRKCLSGTIFESRTTAAPFRHPSMWDRNCLSGDLAFPAYLKLITQNIDS